MNITRRDTLALGGAAATIGLIGTGPALAADGDVVDIARLMASVEGIEDHVLGDPDAPVTVIEYASPTCPHCANFHNEVFPAFREQYVDTGHVRFIVRPFVRNVLDAVVFLLAEAAGPESYYDVLDTYFHTMPAWSTSSTPRDALYDIAVELGFTEESFNAALTNQALFDAMEAMREQAMDEFGMTGTPTFYVNGKTLSGNRTLEELAAEIDPLLS